MHHDPPPTPHCPVCEADLVRNHHLPEQLGPWRCDTCWLFLWGTVSEWLAYEPTRRDRARRMEENE
jgi:hypothetical protein